MKKLIIFIFIIFLTSLNVHSAFLNITIDYNKSSDCKLDKQILKNEVYNYKEFTKDQIKKNKNKKININALKSKELKILGLSDFFSNIPDGAIYDTQILKDDTILLRILTNDENYSESVFINKSSGEMIHEITSNRNTQNQGKEILFFTCDMS
mgnify:CR=1 FL=1|tara:strand:+ start:777 stop:1235 length:459 start_codon:yes stop_codon:yes gene_type:complete